MYDLKTIGPDQVAAIFRDRATADIEIPSRITQFKEHVPDVDFSSATEVAPSPVVVNAETLGQSLVYGGDDLQGKYLRLVLYVYGYGGKIHYTELPSGNYKATVGWPVD